MPTADPGVPTRRRRARLTAAWGRTCRLVGGPWTTGLLCLGGLALILLLDRAQQARRWSVPVTALLDEPAHLVTAGLVLLALLPWRARAIARWALAASVLIDLDHVPLYLWGALTVDGHGRPVTHSLATVLALALAGLAGPRRLRTALLGLSLGVGLHLFRDVATGPGVRLWWPVETDSVLLPYAAYVVASVAVTAIAVGRQVRRHLTRSAHVPHRP
jgi:inner membrane protein